MGEIKAQLRIAAPRDRVFELLSNHERFIRQPGFVTTVVRDGIGDRNGLGCVREIRGPGLRFVEEVTAWDAPNAYEYRIVKSTVPIDHRGSRIELSGQDGAVDVTWSGAADVRLPLIGRLFGGLVDRGLQATFQGLLKQAKRELEASAPDTQTTS